MQGAKEAAYRACQKEVVLAKNHGGVLPMAPGKKVYIAVFSGEDAGAALAQMMGAGGAGKDDNEALRSQLAQLFTQRGFQVVDTPEDCD